MLEFLEVTVGSSTTKTFINLAEVAVVELSPDKCIFHFRGDPELKTTISALTPEGHDKLSRLFGKV
jgi:hypothetical protein